MKDKKCPPNIPAKMPQKKCENGFSKKEWIDATLMVENDKNNLNNMKIVSE